MDISNKKWGMMCLCGFLMLECIFGLTNVRIEYGSVIQGVLAGAAGVFLFMDK